MRDNLMWKGPYEDGVTQSILSDFIRDPLSAYFKLILGVKSPGEMEPNLMWGDSAHKGLEVMINNLDLPDKERFPLAVTAAQEYLQENYPYAPPTFKYSIAKMLRLFDLSEHKGDWQAEQEIDKVVSTSLGDIRFRGKKDGQCYNHPNYRRVLEDHKFKGFVDTSQTATELKEDLQVNMYLFLEDEPTEWFLYNEIRIPDTQKFGPQMPYDCQPKDWIRKLYNGEIGSYGGQYPIYNHPERWVHQKAYYLPYEEQELYWKTTVIPWLFRLCEWYEYVTKPGFNHEDPSVYNHIFYKNPVRLFDGRRTEKYKCEYHAVLTGQVDISELEPITNHFPELESSK